MNNLDLIWYVSLAIILAALSIGYLKQRIQLAKYQHQITQNMIALNKAVKALKGKK